MTEADEINDDDLEAASEYYDRCKRGEEGTIANTNVNIIDLTKFVKISDNSNIYVSKDIYEQWIADGKYNDELMKNTIRDIQFVTKDDYNRVIGSLNLSCSNEICNDLLDKTPHRNKDGEGNDKV